MWFLLVVALTTAEAAATCDATALAKAVDEANPATVARAWAALAACDGEAAKPKAEATFQAALAGSDAHGALIHGIDLGLDVPVRDWLRRAPADERSKAMSFLGGQCKEHPKVPTFLVATHEAIGPEFWAERWQRSLADCRTPEVQKFLSDSLRGDEVGIQTAVDRAQFFSLLDVYAKNLRAGALPTLQEFARSIEDESEVVFVVRAFGDAAGVGTTQGVDFAVAQQAVKALQDLGPELPPRAVDQARTVLLALGDEQASDAYARYRWPAAFRNGGYAYSYAVVAVEISTCGNGKKQAIAHHAKFKEPGSLWPDQVAELLKDKLVFEWALDGSNVCNGEWAVEWHVPPEPFETDEARDAWVAEQLAAYRVLAAGFSKAQVRAHDAFGL